MATQEQADKFIIIFLIFIVILNIALFIAASLHMTSADVPPQIVGAMLLGSLIALGLVMIFKPHRIHAFLSKTPSNQTQSIPQKQIIKTFYPLPSKYNPPRNPILKQPSYRPDPSQPLQVNVENAIRRFQPRKRYQYEIDYQNELYNWLSRVFPVQYEVQTGSSRPDLIIKNIAIEIKGPTGNRELDTLTTKFLKYSNHYPYFIIVLFDCNFSDGHFNEISKGIRKFAPHVKIIKK